MQIFTLCYNLKFRKLTLYGFTRPQSIRKSKQIPGQTIFFLTVNALMLDLSSRVFVLISRLILGRNSSFQILLNSFALKFPSFITLGSLGTGAAGPQLPRLFCPLWLYQGDRRLCTIEFFLDHNDHHHDHLNHRDHLNFFSGFFTQLHKLRLLRRSFLHFQIYVAILPCAISFKYAFVVYIKRIHGSANVQCVMRA